MSDITITASIRSNLLSLQNTTRLLDITSERLSTGKRVNSALDNANSFFTARGLSNRANDLSARKDAIGQSISLLQATDTSINTITALVEQAKAVAQQAEEASTSGVATVSSQAAVLSGVTTISTEAAAAASTTFSTISSDAANAATGSTSTISSAAIAAAAGTVSVIHTETGNNITNSAADTLATIFAATTSDQFTVQVGSTGDKVTIRGDDTLDSVKSQIEAALDNVTVTIDLTTDKLNFVVAGGGTLIFTDTITADTIVGDLGLEDSNSVAIATGASTTFASTQAATDTVAKAFALTADDVLTIDLDGGSGTNDGVIFTVGSKTVAELVTFISAVDSDITASYNATTTKIDITSANGGDKLTFTGATALTALVLDAGGTTITTGAVATFTTTGADSDTLISAFDATATDVLTVDYNGSNIQFTVGNSTIAELVTAISGIDADITASYNTTSDKIEITTAVGGAALTFTETEGTPLTELIFSNGTSNVASGTAETFSTTATATDLASVAFGVDASDTFTVALTGGGTGSVDIGSKTIAELVSAISAVDSAITASFNTSTSKIDVSSTTGQSVTFTNATAVAQVDTVTLTGDVETGDIHSVTINGTEVSYTVVAADLAADGVSGTVGTNTQQLNNVRAKLFAAINSNTTTAALVTAAAGSGTGELTLTADTIGTKINTSALTTTDVANETTASLAFSTAAANGAKQVDTLTIAGTIDAGDVLSYTLNETTYSYTVLDGDTVTTAADALATLITANGLAAADNTAGVITITGATNGIGFNSSASVALNDTVAAATLVSTTAAVGADAISGLALDGTFSSVTSGVATTFTDTTVAVTSGDLLTSAYSGIAVGDAFSIAVGTGGTATFTVGVSTTIADLVTAIGASDSALTASYDTTSKAIEVSATTGAEVTFTNTSGTAIASLGLTNGTSTLTSGTAVTYGSSGSATQVASLNTDYASILGQIDTLLSDASYKGTNLLSGNNDFIVKFNADGSSSLTLTGLNLGVTNNTELKFTLDATGYDFTGTGIGTALADTQNAIDHLRSVASTFGTGLGIVQTRKDFTDELVSVLQKGSGKLINANLEEESANLLALQTRQALGIQSLSIANQSQQSVLSLFR